MSTAAVADALMEAEFIQSFGHGGQLHFLATRGFFEGASLEKLASLHARWTAVSADPARPASLRHPLGLELLGRVLSSSELREKLKDASYAAFLEGQLAAFAAAGSPLPLQ